MSILLERIVILCKEHRISISFLEKECSISNGCIKKWETRAPSIDKIGKIARYFDVSMDYLVGNTEIRALPESFVEEKTTCDLFCAYEKMSAEDRQRAIQILKIGFPYAFKDEEEER